MPETTLYITTKGFGLGLSPESAFITGNQRREKGFGVGFGLG